MMRQISKTSLYPKAAGRSLGFGRQKNVAKRTIATKLTPESPSDDHTFMGALRSVLGDDAAKIERLIREQSVTDIVLDAGRAPVVYFSKTEPPCSLSIVPIEKEALDHIWNVAVMSTGSQISGLTSRTGACMSRPLDRLSKMHGFDGSISGLTWRVGCHEGREVPADLKNALIDRKNTLVYGPPGSGKTTLLRAIATYCSDTLKDRVVVVDATGELGGFHPATDVLGYFTRRMCVAPGMTHEAVMYDAIRNHTPSTIIVDEIVTRGDAEALSSAAVRGIRVIATTHATSLSDILYNPQFRCLTGNIKDAAVTDARAKASHGHKFAKERTLPVCFPVAYGVHSGDLETDVASRFDTILKSM